MLTQAGAALCAAALVLPPAARAPARLRGVWALAAFGALAVFTALSATRSLMPNDSWLEANRTFAYFATFAGALAHAPRALERGRDRRRDRCGRALQLVV